ncbi:MAG: DUF5320 domain-containing protein [Candidatus Methanospirareceae archaeon]
MAYGYGYGYGGGGYRYRRRNMYYLTGLPGWLRFGFSPGWVGRSPTGLPPTPQYLTQTGQMPQPQVSPPQTSTSASATPTHKDCISFVPPNKCSLKGIEVEPTGSACEDFQPRIFMPMFPFFGAPTGFGVQAMTKEQEIQMLEAQAKMLEQQIEWIKKRIEELK